MARVLAIDHGDARVGLALSDELAFLAHPLETIQVAQTDPVTRIVEVVKQYHVTTIVLGMPYRMDGSEGTAVEKVREFGASLVEKLGPGIKMVEVDERLSTKTAQEQLHAAGRNIKNSRQIIDQAAARVILQDYLDSQRPPPSLDDWEDREWDDEDE